MENFGQRVRLAWNAFFNRDPTPRDAGYGGTSVRPDRRKLSRGNERSLVTAIYNRIAMDVSAISIKHVLKDENGRFVKELPSGLNECLSMSANIDQTGRSLIHDAMLSMMDEGHVALVPVDIDLAAVPEDMEGKFKIESMRTAKIRNWYPRDIRVEMYNEQTGKHEMVTLAKEVTCIIENPLYAVMNEPNSTMQRLLRKLSLLDSVDEKVNSGKLDMIIQLPYLIKNQTKREQADIRRKEIEQQLVNSQYGIAYIDGTEKVTQLNRPLENNLMYQIESLTATLYSQLGITQAVMDGSASEQEMLNYYNRTVEPFLSAITDDMRRKFLSKEDRDNMQDIMFFRNPFKLISVQTIANIADTFTRNEILTSNEVRQIIGMKPSDDPNADILRNKNLNPQSFDPYYGLPQEAYPEAEYNIPLEENQNTV